MQEKSLRVECPLDEQYAALYSSALRVAEAFIEQVNLVASVSPEERPLHSHLLISVRIRTPGCWQAVWCKKILLRDTDQGRRTAEKLRRTSGGIARYVTVEIPKGEGAAYPASTFKGLPLELREAAIYHERLLTQLRKVSADNRALKRAMNYALARQKKAQQACDEAIETARELRNSTNGPKASNHGAFSHFPP